VQRHLPDRPGPPEHPPIGIVVARVAKAMERAFDQALAAAGGTRPTWLVLLAVKSGSARTQSALAERVGISGPTLTHHLDRMEAAGLVARTAHPASRRAQVITLTPAGEAMFVRLRDAAVAFDARARRGLGETDMERLRSALRTLHDNVTGAPAAEERGP
jgi:MarR family transcriptional regulator, transcriptional regulator for hemolysin